MTGWFENVGRQLGGAVADALRRAGQSSGSPWGMPRALPLEEVDWSTAVPASAIAQANETQWPPTPVAPRVERLKLYHDLWRGDLGTIMDMRQLAESAVGAINLFRRTGKFVADLMVREAPMVDGIDLEPLTMVHDIITDMIRYGAGMLLIADGPEGPLIERLDAQYAIPTAEGGWIVAEPRMSPTSESTLPDVLQFTLIHDGEAGVLMRTQTPTGVQACTNLGPVRKSGIIGTDAEVVVIPALPTQPGGMWGTSWYDDLITIVVQTARRMAANTKVLDENSNPLLLLRGDLNRYTSIPGVPKSSAVTASPGEIEQNAEVNKRLVQSGPLVLPDGVQDAEYVTWDGSLEAAEAMLNRIDSHYRAISGIPAVLEADQAIASGMSLRRMFWQFDATVAPMHHMVSQALTGAVERFGGTLEWANVFEVAGEDPTMTQREDVEDEDDARRGEDEEDEE